MVHCRLLMIVCLGALALAGCASAVEPTPTPTSTPEPSPTPILHQQITYLASRLQAGFKLSLPQDWHYRVSETGLMLANDPVALEGSDMLTDTVVADLSLRTPAEALAYGVRNAAGVLDIFVGRSPEDTSESLYSAVELLEIAERDSAQLAATIADNDTLLLAMALEDHYLLAVVVSPTGKMQELAADLSGIFASTQLLPAQ